MTLGRERLLSEEDQARLAIRLHRGGFFGIRENPDQFLVLKSGRISPHYFDIRPAISDYEQRLFIATQMLNLANLRAQAQGYEGVRDAYNYIAGTPEAMTSYATSIADLAHMGILQPRVNTKKKTGNVVPILGRYERGAAVAEFDDVITDGQSKIDTIEALGAAGLIVADYFVVLDREEGGAKQVAEMTGHEIIPALGASMLVKVLFEESEISRTQFDNVVAYLDEYGDPHAKELLSGS